jgi:hypothetical protein
MGKFTKTLVAAAIAGLVAGPAQAGGFYGSERGVIQISGSNCITERVSPIPMTMLLLGGEGGESNIGFWESDLFSFGADPEEFDGDGPFIAATPVTRLTMGMGPLRYDAMEEFMDEYIFSFNDAKEKDTCRSVDDFNFSNTDITQFDTKVSKNESRARTTLRATGSYYDFDADKDRKVKLIVKSGTMNRVFVD